MHRRVRVICVQVHFLFTRRHTYCRFQKRFHSNDSCIAGLKDRLHWKRFRRPLIFLSIFSGTPPSSGSICYKQPFVMQTAHGLWDLAACKFVNNLFNFLCIVFRMHCLDINLQRIVAVRWHFAKNSTPVLLYAASWEFHMHKLRTYDTGTSYVSSLVYLTQV